MMSKYYLLFFNTLIFVTLNHLSVIFYIYLICESNSDDQFVSQKCIVFFLAFFVCLIFCKLVVLCNRVKIEVN